MIVCANKECGYKRPVDDEATAQPKATRRPGHGRRSLHRRREPAELAKLATA